MSTKTLTKLALTGILLIVSSVATINAATSAANICNMAVALPPCGVSCYSPANAVEMKCLKGMKDSGIVTACCVDRPGYCLSVKPS